MNNVIYIDIEDHLFNMATVASVSCKEEYGEGDNLMYGIVVVCFNERHNQEFWFKKETQRNAVFTSVQKRMKEVKINII